VWDEAIAGHQGAGSTGEALEDAGAAGTPPTVQEIADQVWDEALSGHLGAGSTGEALNAAGAAGDPWVTALPGAYGAGSAGKIVGDNLNAPVATVDTVVDAIKAKTDNLPSDPADESLIEAAIAGLNDLDAAGVRSAVGLASANLDTQLGDLPTNAELATSQAAADDATLAAIAALSIPTAAAVADAVWDEAIAGHLGAGSTGEKLNGASAPSAAAVADAVWDEALSGHLGAGTTGAALNAASSGSAAGPGAISWDVLVQEGVDPVQGAAVWVSTDAGGANVVAGSLITPSNGTVTFLLDAGTYYAFVRKDGLNPVNGQAFTVS
jgi:hypothetical protein